MPAKQAIAEAKGQAVVDLDVVGGTVTKVDGGTITLQAKTLQTVTTDASTQFLKEGNQDGSLGDIKVGMPMKAVGKMGGDGTLHAERVGFGMQ